MADQTPNTKAAPGEAEIEAAAKGIAQEAEGGVGWVYSWGDIMPEAYPVFARAALTAAYAIRLPPLLAELERYREALERIANLGPTHQIQDIARRALQEQSGE